MIDYGMIKSRFFWIISALLVFGMLFIFSYHEDSITISPSYQTSSMTDLHLKHKEGNKIKWELSSEQAILPVGNKKVFLTDLALKINHTPELFLTSGSGMYEIEKGNVALSNRVELNIEDTKFTTETMNWSSSDELISSDDDVDFRGSNFRITGTGLSAHVEKEQVRIVKNVKAIFYR